MSYENVPNKLFFLLALSVASNHCQLSVECTIFHLNQAHIRHHRRRCLQQFPQAEIVNYTDTHETHCFLHCFLYKMGLMDLTTRGLNSCRFIDIWENINETFVEDNCLERFDFSEPLSGNCGDTYRKLMEFRNNCLELFEYTFSTNIVWDSHDPGNSKNIGQSATEFCDLNEERQDMIAKENSQDNELSLMSLYKDKLKCIFENIHYLDAYGRVDENEINLSYQEASEDARATVRDCTHRANSKYQQDYLGNSVLELQKCLKAQSPVYDKVFKVRDEISRQY